MKIGNRIVLSIVLSIIILSPFIVWCVAHPQYFHDGLVDAKLFTSFFESIWMTLSMALFTITSWVIFMVKK